MTTGGAAGPTAGPTTGSILCVNIGSSSVKAALYDLPADPDAAIGAHDGVARMLVDGIGTDRAHLLVRATTGDRAVLVDEDQPVADQARGLDLVLDAVSRLGRTPSAVGHRVVHGGPELRNHVRLDAGDEVLATLRAAVSFAPLHLPAEIAGVEAAQARLPGVAQVLCLDTAFHQTLPEVAWHFPLPSSMLDRGIRRYGFHGLSYEYVVDTVGAGPLGRAIIAHLGSGASLAAIQHGRSVDTTMGLTPTGGIVMGTRPGDLDPGVLLHVLAPTAHGPGMDPEKLTRLLDHGSGLFGLTDGVADVRTLLDRRAAGEDQATLALAIFVQSIRKAVGALTTVLEGVDTLVFTAGVGEHSPAIRADVTASLAHLGIVVDPDANDAATGRATWTDISAPAATTRTLVVPTDEELMIARHTAELTR